MTATPPPSPSPANGTDAGSDSRERWLFLISGGLLLLALLVAMGRERHWGEPQFQVTLLAPRADGLQEGMEVRLSGMPIGRLDALRLRSDARVEATLDIHKRYRPLIGPRSRAQSGQVGLVGRTYVSLTPDPQPKGARTEEPLPALAYEPPPDLNQIVAQLATSNQQLDRTLAQASNLLQGQVPSSLGSLRTSMGTLSGSMGDLSAMSKTVAGETRRTVPSVRTLTNTLNQEAVRLGPAARRTLTQADQTLVKAEQTAVAAERATKEAQALLRQANPKLIPTLQNMQEITEAGAKLVRFLSGLGLLEPGGGRFRSTPAQNKATQNKSDAMDAYKVHPTSPGPSPYTP